MKLFRIYLAYDEAEALVVHETAEEAEAFYLIETGIDPSEIDDVCEVNECEADLITFSDYPGLTVHDAMKGVVEPIIMAEKE